MWKVIGPLARGAPVPHVGVLLSGFKGHFVGVGSAPMSVYLHSVPEIRQDALRK